MAREQTATTPVGRVTTSTGDRVISHREEVANIVTHGIGALVSAVAGAALVALTILGGNVWQIVSAVVYSATLLLLYTASTLFHRAPAGPLRSRLEIFDHCAIFLLIAGTYTPFTLVTLRGPWGWSLFGLIWALAAGGILFKLLFGTRLQVVSTLIYIGMGWLIVVAAGPLIQALPLAVLIWLVVGGVAYTAGTIFFLSEHIPFTHAIWHLFVLAGSACHFVAVCTQLLPRIW